jgi:hypothetical protein
MIAGARHIGRPRAAATGPDPVPADRTGQPRHAGQRDPAPRLNPLKQGQPPVAPVVRGPAAVDPEQNLQHRTRLEHQQDRRHHRRGDQFDRCRGRCPHAAPPKPGPDPSRPHPARSEAWAAPAGRRCRRRDRSPWPARPSAAPERASWSSGKVVAAVDDLRRDRGKDEGQPEQRRDIGRMPCRKVQRLQPFRPGVSNRRLCCRLPWHQRRSRRA